MKTIFIHEPILNATLTILIGSIDDSNNYMKLTYNIDNFIDNDSTCLGLYKELIKNNITKHFIWMPKFSKNNADNISTLVHETSHYIFYLFKDRGIEHNINTDEFYSYYLDYMVEQFFMFLNVKPLYDKSTKG